MTLKLYKLNASPPARSVMMTCDLLGLSPELKDVDILNKEHLTPYFLKMNPLHTIPVLSDGELVIRDSHAALMYLADKYGKNDSLYPKDIAQRALINQQLFLNNSILFMRLRNVTFPAIVEGPKKITAAQEEAIIEAYGFVEEFLTRHKYIATDEMTIADIAAFATVSSLLFLIPLDPKFTKTKAWLAYMEAQQFSKKCNAPGNAEFANIMKKIIIQ